MLPWASPIEGLLSRLRDLWRCATWRRNAGLRYRSASRAGPDLAHTVEPELAVPAMPARLVVPRPWSATFLPNPLAKKPRGSVNPTDTSSRRSAVPRGTARSAPSSGFRRRNHAVIHVASSPATYRLCPETLAVPRFGPGASTGARLDREVLGAAAAARRPVRRVVGVPLSSATAAHRGGWLPRLWRGAAHVAEADACGPLPETGTAASFGSLSATLGLPRKAHRVRFFPTGRSRAGWKGALLPHAAEAACGADTWLLRASAVRPALALPLDEPWGGVGLEGVTVKLPTRLGVDWARPKAIPASARAGHAGDSLRDSRSAHGLA
jgi:hypothetical protein